MIYIERNSQRFGPYDDNALISYIESGQVLLSDKGYDDSKSETTSVRQYIKDKHLSVKVKHAGSFTYQLNRIGTELLFPKDAFTKKSVISDTRLILLGLVGLIPSVLMFLPIGGLLVFYLISLYFAVIWGLFFYYFFKTTQVKIKTTVSVFCITQVAVFLIWDILELTALNPFYHLIDSAIPLSFIGYTLGVGLTEELGKSIPLLIISRKAKEPLIPQTLVFYGLMSGIAFGVFEGVQYQVTINAQQEYVTAYMLNILRLTSLPFIHAVWCGIGGYFIAFANLYPKYRMALYFFAIGIPALLHGIYDTFCGTLLGTVVVLPVMIITVILLNAYLKQGVNYQSKLRN